MEVLHVMNAAGGGAAMSTTALVRELRRLGVRSSAVCHDMGSDDEKHAVADAFEGRVVFRPLFWWNFRTRAEPWKRPLIEARDFARSGALLASSAVVTQAARRWRADIVHTATAVNLEGAFAAALLGVPHVWHVRELIGPSQPYRFALEGPALGAFMASLSSTIVANSQATAKCLAPWLPSDASLCVVENGVELGDLEALEPRASMKTADELVVAMVGSLTTRWKKHELFVRCAAKVCELLGDDAKRVRFVIYGRLPPAEDPYLAGIRDAIARSGGRVELRGFVPPTTSMSEIDVLVHPADGESFGRIVVEAMAGCVPVVGVRGGGVEGIVVDGETGLLAQPDDADGLARNVVTLLCDRQLRRRLGHAGRERAALRFSSAAMAAAMMHAYSLARGAPRLADRSMAAVRGWGKGTRATMLEGATL